MHPKNYYYYFELENLIEYGKIETTINICRSNFILEKVFENMSLPFIIDKGIIYLKLT